MLLFDSTMSVPTHFVSKISKHHAPIQYGCLQLSLINIFVTTMSLLMFLSFIFSVKNLKASNFLCKLYILSFSQTIPHKFVILFSQHFSILNNSHTGITARPSLNFILCCLSQHIAMQFVTVKF